MIPQIIINLSPATPDALREMLEVLRSNGVSFAHPIACNVPQAIPAMVSPNWEAQALDVLKREAIERGDDPPKRIRFQGTELALVHADRETYCKWIVEGRLGEVTAQAPTQEESPALSSPQISVSDLDDDDI